MEVTITKFRRDLFRLVDQAFEGGEVWVTHRSHRFRIVPENAPGGRLSHITPMQVLNPDSSRKKRPSLGEEMRKAWERDWSAL